ncbi:DUF6088 family protein [Zhongshania marina]|uniref:AbiEi antitoxin C-terminal domain-containing protein n=1 Tax=Zhongshania marina TaxID=2304603 RepID=A0A2S4HKJ7_9GAMM|nr:DUF6088 family protein [Marortus luteolus]POP54516.1 hypothetical protein C0068_01655 [Marortus luteolus]
MTVAQAVQNRIRAMPEGQIFGYEVLPDYFSSPTAVVKAVNRLVKEQRLARFAKGKFYLPRKGALGPRKPADSELIRAFLYKNGRLRGYVTGQSLFNRLGLSTQVPRTVTVALNGGRQSRDFGTIKVQTVIARAPVTEDNVTLLQYLDVLKDIKGISDTTVDDALVTMNDLIAKLSVNDQRGLLALAEAYYTPQTKALLGLVYSNLKLALPEDFATSLNPTTVYKLGVDEKRWPHARMWNIR